MISQILVYGIVWWIVFVAIAFAAAHVGQFWGIMTGHLLIAGIVITLDLQWVQAEMSQPDWDGAPDHDFISMFGVLIRVVLINTFLLPVSALGWCLRNLYAARPATEPPTTAE